MKNLTDRNKERLVFTEIAHRGRVIKQLELQRGNADEIQKEKEIIEARYQMLLKQHYCHFIDFAPALKEIEESVVEHSILKKLKSFNYLFGNRFFDYAKVGVLKELMPVEFIENSKNVMCVYSKTRFYNYLFDFGLTDESLENVETRNIEFAFITHEHLDHCSGIEQLYENSNITFFANEDTFNIISSKYENAKNLKWYVFRTGEHIFIKNTKISTIELRHDSVQNVAYKVDDGVLKTVYMVDLGKWTDAEIEFCNDADRIIIESYYDENAPKRKSILESRMRSAYGHLSHQSSKEFLSKLKPNPNREVYFCHN